MTSTIDLRSGILLVDKPRGVTSHDVVSRIRRLANTRKVGHAGTLDPMATGLLIVGINSATRLLTYFVGLDKEYLATIRLGQSSTTDDAEGELTQTRDAMGASADDLAAAVANLTGPISQIPSSVSAIKVDGKRAYALVRAGEAPALKPRDVEVFSLDVIDVRRGVLTDVDVRVVCSSGTYIRAIARDLGIALGVGGHLTALRRTRVGPFSLANAFDLDELDVATALLSPASAAAALFPTAQLDDQQAIDLAHGKSIELELEPVLDVERDLHRGHDRTVAAVAPDGRLVGLAKITSGIGKPIVNFPEDGTGK